MGGRLSPKLAIDGLGKRYGGVTALQPTTLDVARGEFLTLLGPSGSGKTTLLMMIAGLTAATTGAVRLDGQDITALPAYRRNIGVVFQNYALFPHLSVFENVAFPLRMRKQPAPAIAAAVGRALDLVRLGNLADRLPRELSGGQQQRVAFARAVVFGPELVLMDEPLGALDKKLRDELKLEIRRLHRELGTTVVYVTHDQEEAMLLSDRICLMNEARVEQVDTPAALYARPATRFAATFLGESNILDAIRTGDGVALGGLVLPFADDDSLPAVGARCTVLIRPERIGLGGPHEGVVETVLELGGTRRMSVRLAAGPCLNVTTLGGAGPASGDTVGLVIDHGSIVPLTA